ncbi:PIN domain-containing protein [Pseudomonas sp. Q2-TVG4-2]|uniref:PIN domain-containing protein n=1 Tax=Pseudomonas sp. Q2-TVG4-2 TaxID=1685699 RepID=UPI0015E723AD|nr:PIN domain-containing protein [Pseudomonas sp. Q2-TVG4-2]
MKDKFPGHFSNPAADHSLWDRCIFVFDTNILLNLYRYSDETRALFIKTLRLLQERIWIPYRVADEYLENRLNVIYEQQEEYEKAIAEINKLKGKLENSRQHPFVSAKTMKGVAASLEKAIEELSNNKDVHTRRITSDEIKDEIADIFEDRVGNLSSDAELEDIIKEGTARYEQKIPPGYSDIKKQGGDSSLTSRCRPYGDLIIWKEIIGKAKEVDTPIIFVTDDGKEDWWLRFKGKTIGPRPELIKEFQSEVNQLFHMYLPERFLSLATEKEQEKPSKEVLEEIRDVRQKELDISSENRKTKRQISTFKSRSFSLDNIFLRRNQEDNIVTPWHEQELSYRAELEELHVRTSELSSRRDGARDLVSYYAQMKSLRGLSPEEESEHAKLTTSLDLLSAQLDDLRMRRRYILEKMHQLQNMSVGLDEWNDA